MWIGLSKTFGGCEGNNDPFAKCQVKCCPFIEVNPGVMWIKY